MRVTRTTILEEAINASPMSAKARDLKAWLGMARRVRWAGPADILKDFPNANSSDNIIWLFPLRGSGATVEAQIGFRGSGQIVIRQVH